MKPGTFFILVLVCVTTYPYAHAETTKQHSVRGGYKASKLVGTPVLGPHGKELGRIEEIVIGTTGLTGYVVLSFGGVLGVGDKLFAIPWSKFRHSPDKEHLILDLPHEQLEQARGFNKQEWPDVNDERWQIGISDVYQRESHPSDASPIKPGTSERPEEHTQTNKSGTR